MNFWCRFILLLILVYLLSPVLPVSAEGGDVDPQFNPVCWLREDCVQMRKDTYGYDDTKAAEGFLEKQAPCQKENWGKCLPGGVTTASVSFGGKDKFTNIGDYIVTVYNYALRIAAILAVVVIIIAGVQYVTAGGNSEMITGAKKRITNAFIGLLIAYLTYFILNSINPALVALRLPQIYMLRKFNLAPEFCIDATSTAGVVYFADTGKKPGETLEQSAYSNVSEFNLTMADVIKVDCGKGMYFIKDAGGIACMSAKCEANHVCVKNFQNTKGYGCIRANVYGKVGYSTRVLPACTPDVEGWENPAADIGETELWAICKNGDSTDVTTNSIVGATKSNELQEFYLAANLEQVRTICDKSGGLKGFAIMMEMDEACDPVDEEHLIGKNGVDLGDEEFFGRYATKIKDEFFISLAELQGGVGIRVDVNAAKIYDIDDGDPERMRLYKELIQE